MSTKRNLISIFVDFVLLGYTNVVLVRAWLPGGLCLNSLKSSTLQCTPFPLYVICAHIIISVCKIFECIAVRTNKTYTTMKLYISENLPKNWTLLKICTLYVNRWLRKTHKKGCCESKSRRPVDSSLFVQQYLQLIRNLRCLKHHH